MIATEILDLGYITWEQVLSINSRKFLRFVSERLRERADACAILAEAEPLLEAIDASFAMLEL